MASLGDILTARAIGIAWNSYQRDRAVAPFLGRSFFGTQKKDGLSLRWITGADGLPVALKGAAFDALAPLRDPIGFSSIEQEMPFFRESVVTLERDEQEYARFAEAAGNDTYTAQILRQVMKNPMGLIDGATIVPERMIWQLIAPADGVPKITVAVDGGATYDIAYTGDAGVAYKATNYSANSGNSLWSAAATATPIADLIAMSKKNVTAHGKRITTFVMNATTWGYLMNAASTREIVLGTVAAQGGQLLFDNQVRQFILSNLGATVLVYDKVYAGASGATPFIPDGVVTGIAEGTSELGTVWFGTTPEERSGDASIGNLALVETGVAVYTYTTPHPINTHTVVSEIVLPSYENMNDVAVYKVA